jgi:hypothetical protein
VGPAVINRDYQPLGRAAAGGAAAAGAAPGGSLLKAAGAAGGASILQAYGIGPGMAGAPGPREAAELLAAAPPVARAASVGRGVQIRGRSSSGAGGPAGLGAAPGGGAAGSPDAGRWGTPSRKGGWK